MGLSEYSNTIFGLKYPQLVNYSHVTVDLRLLTTHYTSDSALFAHRSQYWKQEPAFHCLTPRNLFPRVNPGEFQDRVLTSTDESILDDDLFTDAAVFGLLESLHPESMGVKSLQLFWLKNRKKTKKNFFFLKKGEMLVLKSCSLINF